MVRRAGAGLDDRLVGAGTGGSTAPDPPPFLEDFLAAGGFAGGSTAGGFLATAFLVAGFFPVVFFAVAFFAAGFVAAVFREVVLFGVDFFAVGFFDRLFAVDFRAALFAAVFLTVFFAVFLTVFFAEDFLGVTFFLLEDADDELLFRVEGFRAGLMGAGR